jgi:hypothetical protein
MDVDVVIILYERCQWRKDGIGRLLAFTDATRVVYHMTYACQHVSGGIGAITRVHRVV